MRQTIKKADANEPFPVLNVYKGLFWDFDYDNINWQKSYRSIIERVLERGTKEEWQELIHFYGKTKIINALMLEIKYLPEFVWEPVCNFFELKKDELACYIRMQSRKGLWP